MSKGLSQFPEDQRVHIATRRLIGNTRGIGFWAAKSFFDKKRLPYPAQCNLYAGQIMQAAMERFNENGSSFHTEEVSTAQPKRHFGEKREGGAPAGRPKRRGFRSTSSDKRRSRNARVGVHQVPGAVPPMAGGASPYPRHEQNNHPRTGYGSRPGGERPASSGPHGGPNNG